MGVFNEKRCKKVKPKKVEDLAPPFLKVDFLKVEKVVLAPPFPKVEVRHYSSMKMYMDLI
jgi:hypothetical protein